MIRSTLRLYLTANVLACAAFAAVLFPEGFSLCLLIFLVSCLVTVPTLALLLACFAIIEKYRLGLAASWLILILTVAACSAVPPAIVHGNGWPDDDLFAWISLGAGFGALLLHSFFLHKQFKSLHHENR